MKNFKSMGCLMVVTIILTSFSVIFAQNGSDNLTIEPYVFENAKKEKVDAEFGRLKVPENRKKPNGKMIELAFVRFKSTSKNPGSPIIYLAGGPGGSGIGTAKFSRFGLFMAMREFGDVIAFDQRGTGQSKPNLRCSNFIELPFDKPLSREILVKAVWKEVASCAEDWKKKGVDISAYNTVESANDIEDLRKALGVKKLSLWGISYGTHLGLAAIRQHGKNIDRAILAGVEATDDTLKLPGNTQKLLEELDRRVKADTELSKIVPDFLGLVKTVLDRLERKPVLIELTDPKTKEKKQLSLGKFDVQFLASNATGNTQTLSQFPLLFYGMSKGDFSFLKQAGVGIRTRRTPSIMSVAMDCASGISGRRFAQINSEKKKSLFADAINAPYPEICHVLGDLDLGDAFRKPVNSEVPVLFISGTLDGRTPVSNAEFAAKGFKNNTHLIIDGAGHSDPLFLSSPKIKETMMKFMRRVKLPSVIKISTTKPFEFRKP